MTWGAKFLSAFSLNRHLAPVLSVVFAGVLISTLVAYFSTRDTMEGLALGQTRQTLGFLNREITSQVRDTTSRLTRWSQEELYVLALEDSLLGQSARTEAARRMAARVTGSSFDRVFLIRPNGVILTASNPDMVGRFTVGDRGYFQKALAGEINMETLAAGRHSNVPMLVTAAPIRTGDGVIAGVIAVAMETARFAEDLPLGTFAHKTGVSYLLDTTGRVLAAPPAFKADNPWPDWRMDQVRQSAASGEAAHFREADVERVLMAETNTETGWYLVLSADEAELMHPAIRMAWMTGGVSLATLALVALALAALGRAMAVLRQSEEKFSRIFLYSPDSILLADMETGRIVDVNETFITRTGYSREEVLGKTSGEISIYVDLKDREAFHARLRRDGHVEHFECLARYKDGSIATSALSGQVVIIDNRRHLMTMVRDITEIKRMQEMMVQTEKMISVGGIAAGIAHEINNPLGIVLQASQNLVQRTRPDFRKNLEVAAKLGLDMQLFDQYMKLRKLDVFIEDIQSAASRASAIIRHMLDFSRRSESRRTVCDIRAIADSALNLASNDYDLKKSYDFKKIEIVRDYPPDLPDVGCTATEIEQVLLNVFRNAAQAMAQADPPVAAPHIAVRIRGLTDRVRIEIEDNGPVVPEAIRKRIFEPFFTTKQPGIGTGLGLSVSYFIVTKGHGGRMIIETGRDGGAVFCIELPTDERLEV